MTARHINGRNPQQEIMKAEQLMKTRILSNQ